MNVTTRVETIVTDESQRSLWGQENKSSSQHPKEMRCLCGANSRIDPDRRESTARSSEMNRKRSPLTLSEKLTPLLIDAGLVKGTTRTFGQRLSNLGIRAGVSFAPDGSVVATPRQVCIFWKEGAGTSYDKAALRQMREDSL